MTEEELYAGAGEVTRKCLDDILESEYGFVQDDEETYTSEYLLTYPCKTFAEGLTDTLLQHGFSGQADDAKEKIAYVRECCKQRGVTLNIDFTNYFLSPLKETLHKAIRRVLCSVSLIMSMGTIRLQLRIISMNFKIILIANKFYTFRLTRLLDNDTM